MGTQYTTGRLRSGTFFLLLLGTLAAAQSAPSAKTPATANERKGNQEYTADDIVARHLKAIGPAARTIKTREVHAKIAVVAIAGGVGRSDGEAVIVSDQHKLRYQMDFDNTRYRGEQFVFDGNKPYIAEYEPGKLSPFAEFMRAKNELLSEGLFGGAITTGWALLDLSSRNPKVTYDGVKTVDGKLMHQVGYHFSHGPNDVDVKLYFETATFRHLYSRYNITLGVTMGANPNPTAGDGSSASQMSGGPEIRAARQNVARITVEERFGDFVTFDGVTLPTRWEVKFTTDRDRTIVVRWQSQAYRIENDAKLPADSFALRPLPADFFALPKPVAAAR
jgi:hypothetical protein